MNLRQLQYFIAVAEAGGFRQAAARLNVAQPALSRQMQAMEADIDLVLIERAAGRRVALTPAGEAYRRAIQAVLLTVSTSVRRARLASRGEVGQFTISAPRPALAIGHLSRTAERLAERYPGIELTIAEADLPDSWEMLRSGRADLLVGLRPSPDDGAFALEPLWRETVASVLLPASHPLAGRGSVRLAELRDDQFLMMEPSRIPDLWLPMEQALAAIGIAREQVRVVRGMSGVRALVAAGHGWSIVSDGYREQPPTGTVVLPVDDFAAEIERVAIWRADDARGVVEVVRGVLRAVSRGEPMAPVARPATVESEDDVEAGGLPRGLELRHLEYLRAAVNSASIGGAATELAVAQPVLSRQLRDLEQAVGVELLERGHRGVRATAAGELLLRETSRVPLALGDAIHSARRAERGALGQCVLATISTPIGIHVLASVLADCTHTDPLLAIEIVEVPSISQETALLSATVDVGFSVVTSSTGQDAEIVREHMLDDPLDCVLVAQDHHLARRDRIRLAELEALPFLFSTRDAHPAFHDQVMQRLRRLDLRSPVDTTFQSLHLRWARAAEGKGWCLGFRSQRAHAPRGTTAVAVDGLTIPWGMELLWRAGEDREMVSKLIAAFRRSAAVVRREPAEVS